MKKIIWISILIAVVLGFIYYGVSVNLTRTETTVFINPQGMIDLKREDVYKGKEWVETTEYMQLSKSSTNLVRIRKLSMIGNKTIISNFMEE